MYDVLYCYSPVSILTFASPPPLCCLTHPNALPVWIVIGLGLRNQEF
jgi:hypothetical protein